MLLNKFSYKFLCNFWALYFYNMIYKSIFSWLLILLATGFLTATINHLVFVLIMIFILLEIFNIGDAPINSLGALLYIA